MSDDGGLVEFQFSQARLEAARSNSSQAHKQRNDREEKIRPSSSSGRNNGLDKKLASLVRSCYVLQLTDLPYAFGDHHGETLELGSCELEERLEGITECVVIRCRGGHAKVASVDFLAYLLLTEWLQLKYGSGRDAPPWPGTKNSIRNAVESYLSDTRAVFPRLLEARSFSESSLTYFWEYFRDLWIHDDCLHGSSRQGFNWHIKAVKDLLLRHTDILEKDGGQQKVERLNASHLAKPLPTVTDRTTHNDGLTIAKESRDRTAHKNGLAIANESRDRNAYNNGKPMLCVDTEAKLLDVVSTDNIFHSGNSFEKSDVARDICAAVSIVMKNGSVAFVSIVTHNKVYVVNFLEIGTRTACQYLSTFLAHASRLKLFHGMFGPAIAALRAGGGITCMCGCFDSQLALEYLGGDMLCSLNDMLKFFSIVSVKKDDNDDGKRPNSKPPSLANSVKRARMLWEAREPLVTALGEAFDVVRQASDARAARSHRDIVFNKENGYSMMSKELVTEVHSQDNIFEPSALVVNTDVDALLELLPSRTQEAIRKLDIEYLSDIILDKGRPPHCWISGKRTFLDTSSQDEDDELVQQHDIDFVTGSLGWFGSDNRAGIEMQLHRISSMMNRAGHIVGLTLRVGRHIDGNADMICDLLLGNEGSILFLGEPGSGKTTIVREAAKLLSDNDKNVCIIDTSNEIAGDGDIPHPCVGYARRMMVPSLDLQASVMIECVQNHTPSVMVIDEIGRPKEVEAACTCKQRGVRMIASAHGDIRKLVKNPKLKGLIGGIETVTLGDSAAKMEAKDRGSSGIRKLSAQRAGTPVFDMIVEVRRGAHNDWYITLDVAEAVDAILEGKKYTVQHRTRGAVDGSFQISQEVR